VAAALAIAGCGGDNSTAASSSGDSIPKTTLQMGTSAFPTQVVGKAMQKFVDYADQLSHGQVEIKLHGSGALCSEITCVRNVKEGTLDIGTASDSNYGPFTPRLTFVGLPYLWKSQQSQDQVFQGAFGTNLRKQIADKDGLQILAFLDNGGFRQLWNNVGEARTPQQISGAKLRSTGSQVELAMDKAWGEAPVVMNWSEVYSGLQQGVVKGEVVQPNWIRDYKHDEVLKHATLVNAQIGYQVVSMTTTRWNALPKSVQQVLLEAGRKAQQWVAPEDRKDSASALQQIQKAGVQIYQPTQTELQQWVSDATSVWSKFAGTVSQQTIAKVLKAQGCPSTGCVPEIDYHLGS
jgi:TRAP-type C4-dicarboxylate transport system substrate-binding protein